MTNILLTITILLLGYLIIGGITKSFKSAYVEKGIKIGLNGITDKLIIEAKKGKPFKLGNNKEVIWLEIVKKENADGKK